MSQVVIGTAGHIDHGKTALVKALTGTDTDRLAEEKSRGMTIDLGFAFLSDEITIIDVPGHEKFIRNMVSGVSTIKIALVVIAANDGVMPQTREHLQILSLLGIPKGVIAITKTDTADAEWISLIEDDIKILCKGTFLENAPMVRTSSITGEGVDELKDLLSKISKDVKQEHDRGFFRLQVDRRFSKTGFGTVVTGTVVSGELKKGDEVQILPMDKVGRVRGLQSHGKSVDSVQLGDRAAVNLVSIDRNELWRGVELASKGWLSPTKRIIANISVVTETKWTIRSRQRIRIHIGTQQVLAKIIWVKSAIGSGESANVIIEFEEPAILAMDDRFVIRSYSPMDTIAGGIVLDHFPSNNTFKQQKNWTEKLEVDRESRYFQFIDKEIRSPLTLEGWSKIFLISISELKKIIKEHNLRTARGKPVIYSDENLKRSKSLIIDILEDFHKKNPTLGSMKGEELKEKAKFSSAWFEFTVSELIASDKIKGKDSVFWLANYSIELSNKDQKLSEKLIGIFERSGVEPVSVKNLSIEASVSENKVLEILHVLKGQGTAIKVSDILWIRTDSLEGVISGLRKYFESESELSVVDFKNIAGLTRKTAIPLLEYLDKKNITVRQGNIRLKGSEL